MSTTETPGETVPEKKDEAEDDEEKRYEQITDERLQEYIAAERTIPQICKAYKLTDSKYSARLYKRAEKFRSEEERAIIQRLKKPNQQLEDHGWKYYICPVCQKEFSLIGKVGWAYKKKFEKNTYYFCNYTCMRKAEKLM